MKIKVEKMNCMGCLNRIKNHLQQIDQVKNLSIDLTSKTLQVDTSLTRQAILQELERIGYPGQVLSDD